MVGVRYPGGELDPVLMLGVQIACSRASRTSWSWRSPAEVPAGVGVDHEEASRHVRALACGSGLGGAAGSLQVPALHADGRGSWCSRMPA